MTVVIETALEPKPLLQRSSSTFTGQQATTCHYVFESVPSTLKYDTLVTPNPAAAYRAGRPPHLDRAVALTTSVVPSKDGDRVT